MLVQAASGGVGAILCQLAKRAGATVIGTTSSKDKLKYLESLGVDHPMLYQDKTYIKSIRSILGPKKRLDVVFESLGSSHFRKTFALLGAGGRMVSFGFADVLGTTSRILALPKMIFEYGKIRPISLLAKSQTVVGLNALKLLDHKNERIVEAFNQALELTTNGNILIPEGHNFPYTEVARAHNFFEERNAIGKLALVWE